MCWPWRKRKDPKGPSLAWNGKHELKYCTYAEDFGYAGDYARGWHWACTCGTKNITTTAAGGGEQTELAALQGWAEHKKNREDFEA